MVVSNCSMFCCTSLHVHSSIAIILMGKRELIALLNLSSWCLVMVEWLFLAVPRGCLRFVIVVFPGHTHLLFLHVTTNITKTGMKREECYIYLLHPYFGCISTTGKHFQIVVTTFVCNNKDKIVLQPNDNVHNTTGRFDSSVTQMMNSKTTAFHLQHIVAVMSIRSNYFKRPINRSLHYSFTPTPI